MKEKDQGYIFGLNWRVAVIEEIVIEAFYCILFHVLKYIDIKHWALYITSFIVLKSTIISLKIRWYDNLLQCH